MESNENELTPEAVQRMDRETRLEAALAELGGAPGATADDVAARLIADGITGVRRDTINCPVARWLRAHGVEDLEHVAHEHVCLRVSGRRMEVSVEMPPAVMEFILRFDRPLDDAWPELAEPRRLGPMDVA